MLGKELGQTVTGSVSERVEVCYTEWEVCIQPERVEVCQRGWKCVREGEVCQRGWKFVYNQRGEDVGEREDGRESKLGFFSGVKGQSLTSL